MAKNSYKNIEAGSDSLSSSQRASRTQRLTKAGERRQPYAGAGENRKRSKAGDVSEKWRQSQPATAADGEIMYQYQQRNVNMAKMIMAQ
jgi:hypothetical protein